MTLKQALIRAREKLDAAGIDDASLEAEILLRHVLESTRAQLYTDLDKELKPEQAELYQKLIARRLNGEPSAYITNQREFYGLDLFVDSRVLIPRPETEILVEKTLECAQNYSAPVIADIGTGCGAIAICLAINLPEAKIYATDLSAGALEVARLNCEKHRVNERVELLLGDMLNPLPEPLDIIVANLPYVKTSELSGVSSTHSEPELALDGGISGLEKIQKLCHQASKKLNPDGCLLLEIGLGQKEGVTSTLRRLFPSGKIEATPDLAGIDRVVSLTLRASHKV